MSFGTLRPTFNTKSGVETKDVDSSNIVVRKNVLTPGNQLRTMLYKMSVSKYVSLEVVATSGDNGENRGENEEEAPAPAA